MLAARDDHVGIRTSNMRNNHGRKQTPFGLQDEREVDNSDNGSACSSGIEKATVKRARMAQRRKVTDTADGDDGCNWDIEVLQFVLESFILLFPEREDERRGDRRGESIGGWSEISLFAVHCSLDGACLCAKITYVTFANSNRLKLQHVGRFVHPGTSGPKEVPHLGPAT